MSKFGFSFINTVTIIFSTFLVLYSVVAQIENENPLIELSNGEEELVEIAGYGAEKLSTVLVTGSVVCEACFHGEPHQLHQWPISGALVGVTCNPNKKNSKSNRVHGVTDEFGDFTIDLPSHLHANPNLETTCQVEVQRIPKRSHCRPAHHVKKYNPMRLSSAGNGVRTYTAGTLGFLHRTSKSLQTCMK